MVMEVEVPMVMAMVMEVAMETRRCRDGDVGNRSIDGDGNRIGDRYECGGDRGRGGDSDTCLR